MARTTGTDLTKPLYAAAGVGDLAVAQLRRLPAKAVELQSQLASKAERVDVDTIRTTVTRTAGVASERANETYDELVDRGRKLVAAIRNQAATKQLEDQLRNTARAAKATATTARDSVTRTRTAAKGATTTAKKSAARTKTAAKATTTSAKKATDAATKAVEDGADKIG
jgi:heparin binding hemagglutinin HbhA